MGCEMEDQGLFQSLQLGSNISSHMALEPPFFPVNRVVVTQLKEDV